MVIKYCRFRIGSITQQVYGFFGQGLGLVETQLTVNCLDGCDNGSWSWDRSLKSGTTEKKKMHKFRIQAIASRALKNHLCESSHIRGTKFCIDKYEMGFVYVTGFLYRQMNVIPELKNNYKIIEFDW